MARTCMAMQAKALFLRKVRRQLSSLVMASTGQRATHQREDEAETEPPAYNSHTWVPHPRTRIYYPRGHEWVMKDIPTNAASFSRPYWFRDSDGVDDLNPDIDTHTDTVFGGRD